MAHLSVPREDLGRRLTGCLMNKHARDKLVTFHPPPSASRSPARRLSVHPDHRPRASSETYHDRETFFFLSG